MKQVYNLYIDECGDQNLSNFDSQFPIFTLCGILVREDRDRLLQEQVRELKNYFGGHQYVILHSRDIRKCQKGFEILFDLNVKQRFYEALNIILSQEGIYIIVSCSILKEPYIRKFGKYNDVYAQSLSFVIERAIFCLDEQTSSQVTELQTIVEQRGKKEDANLSKFYNELLQKGTYWVTPQRICNYASSFALLPKKANIIGLQLADLVAYPITRHLLDEHEPNLAYDIIKKNIYTSGDKILGIKILP